MRLRCGNYCDFDKESYLWLKERGVSHRLMRKIAENPLKVYEFYRARVDLGKKFAEVKPEAYEEVLEAILNFAKERELQK